MDSDYMRSNDEKNIVFSYAIGIQREYHCPGLS
jgi:hypothetical protein